MSYLDNSMLLITLVIFVRIYPAIGRIGAWLPIIQNAQLFSDLWYSRRYRFSSHVSSSPSVPLACIGHEWVFWLYANACLFRVISSLKAFHFFLQLQIFLISHRRV